IRIEWNGYVHIYHLRFSMREIGRFVHIYPGDSVHIYFSVYTVREKLDPERIFMNHYLNELFKVERVSHPPR
ncbi:hypothetical protein, partial [Sporosarcina sp. P31]